MAADILCSWILWARIEHRRGWLSLTPQFPSLNWDNWKAGYYLVARALESLETFHSYLVVDDGCQLGCQQELLSVFSAWASLGFLTAWRLGSKDECPKKARWKLHLHFNLASEVTEHLDSREGMKT